MKKAKGKRAKEETPPPEDTGPTKVGRKEPPGGTRRRKRRQSGVSRGVLKLAISKSDRRFVSGEIKASEEADEMSVKIPDELVSCERRFRAVDCRYVEFTWGCFWSDRSNSFNLSFYILNYPPFGICNKK